MTIRHELVLATIMTSLLAIVPIARAADGKLDVYVNPLEFDQRIPRLAVGDPAPNLVVDRWIQGPPVGGFEPGTVYVLEFWATWCQPCQKSLPEMEALARRYAGRGLQVLGVAAAEVGGPAQLERFVKEKRLSFPIAYRADSDMYDGWVRAARGSGLPWVFVVDANGRIAWWGQPFYEAFGGVLDAVLAGKWDPTREKIARTARRVNERRGWELLQDVTEASRRQDWELARRDLDTLIALDPERWWWEVVERVNVTVGRLERPAEAKALAAQAIHGVSKDNPHALIALANTLLNCEDPAGRDSSLALEATRRANVLTLGSDADVARVLKVLEAGKKKRERRETGR